MCVGLRYELLVICIIVWQKQRKLPFSPFKIACLYKHSTQRANKTASGFILPGKEGNEKHERGIIVATGPGRFASDGKRIAMEIKKGDTVWFKRGYDAEEVEVDGKTHILTSESNILAVEK